MTIRLARTLTPPGLLHCAALNTYFSGSQQTPSSDGDKSPAESGDKSPHSKDERYPMIVDKS